ncbi:hypothetical protein Ddc_15486 [Ditylenchus destructor]|nr:hypothetical protein Ddc_15486 [Ditylenchus destructor]
MPGYGKPGELALKVHNSKRNKDRTALLTIGEDESKCYIWTLQTTKNDYKLGRNTGKNAENAITYKVYGYICSGCKSAKRNTKTKETLSGCPTPLHWVFCANDDYFWSTAGSTAKHFCTPKERLATDALDMKRKILTSHSNIVLTSKAATDRLEQQLEEKYSGSQLLAARTVTGLVDKRNAFKRSVNRTGAYKKPKIVHDATLPEVTVVKEEPGNEDMELDVFGRHTLQQTGNLVRTELETGDVSVNYSQPSAILKSVMVKDEFEECYCSNDIKKEQNYAEICAPLEEGNAIVTGEFQGMITQHF